MHHNAIKPGDQRGTYTKVTRVLRAAGLDHDKERKASGIKARAKELAEVLESEGAIPGTNRCLDFLWTVETLHRINEAACSCEEWQTVDPEGALEDGIREALVNIAQPWLGDNAIKGLTFNRDPRGYPVGLLLASGRYNTMGGEEVGWRV